MLMTVLKGELAVKQSKALIRTFKQMKDCIVGNQDLIGKRELLQLSMQILRVVKQPKPPCISAYLLIGYLRKAL